MVSYRTAAGVLLVLLALSISGLTAYHFMNGSTDLSDDSSENHSFFLESSESMGFHYEDVEERYLLDEGEAVSGVYVSDVDRDGRQDVLAIGGDAPSIYLNEGGEFVEAGILPELEFSSTPASGEEPRDTDEGRAERQPSVDAALFFDHDNSGYDDLYLLSDEGSVFLENTGGKFEVKEVGLEVAYESVRGAAAADYTGDGCLDVFVVQANDWREHRPAGYNDRDLPIEHDNGERNRLFRGDCASFVETTDEAGIEGEAWSLATSFVDLTDDGYPDIHVANDFNNDVLYLNRGDGSFERRVMPEYTNRNGMSSEVADVTGNGLLDIFVTNIYYPPGEGEVPEHRFGGRVDGNNLLLNEGDGEFRDAAEEYGVVDSGAFGWAALLEDFTNSGELDLFHTVTDAGRQAEQAFWLRNYGGSFEPVPHSDTGFERRASLGAAALDLDGDGRLDIATGNVADHYSLYRNQAADGSYLQVYVDGDGEHTAMGARVHVEFEGGEQMRALSSRSDYQSQSTRMLHFGLGDAEEVDSLRVEWPDGTTREYRNVGADGRVRVSPDEEQVTME